MRACLLACLLLTEAAPAATRVHPSRDPFAALGPPPSAAPVTPGARDLRQVSVQLLRWQGLLRYGERCLLVMQTPDGTTYAVAADQGIGREQARVLRLDDEALLLRLENGRQLQLRLSPAPTAEGSAP